MKIIIDISSQEESELRSLYEESNRIITATGREPWTFEHWCESMLALSAVPHMKSKAEFFIKATKLKYKLD